MTHWSFGGLSRVRMLSLATIFTLIDLAGDLNLTLSALGLALELVYTTERGIALRCLRISVVKIKRLLISEIKGLYGLAHSSLFFYLSRRLSTFVFFIVALHLLMDLKHDLIVRAIWFVFGIFSGLSSGIIPGLSSCRSRLNIRILRLALGVDHQLIINLLSLWDIYGTLLLSFLRCSLVSILRLDKFIWKILLILLLSLIELHLHILLECAHWFVAFVMLISRDRNLIWLLNNCLSLLIFIDPIFLRISSFVLS